MKCPKCLDIEIKKDYKKGNFLCLHCWHADDEMYHDGWERCEKCGKERDIDFGTYY